MLSQIIIQIKYKINHFKLNAINHQDSFTKKTLIGVKWDFLFKHYIIIVLYILKQR